MQASRLNSIHEIIESNSIARNLVREMYSRIAHSQKESRIAKYAAELDAIHAAQKSLRGTKAYIKNNAQHSICKF
jgi:hypothetical protein